MRFGLIGAAGYIAPKHMKAIKELGHNLVVALDPHDSVGRLDQYFPECRYFKETERFDRELYKMQKEGNGLDFVSICSPNYLHDAHCRLALRNGANVICEKPLVISPWNCDKLIELEEETGKKIFVSHQLFYHPAYNMAKNILADILEANEDIKINILYVTPRGPWYDYSWKGDETKSGGLIYNIGIHFLDILVRLLGKPENIHTIIKTNTTVSGKMQFRKGNATWHLSISGIIPKRSFTINDAKIDFTKAFDDLHTILYGKAIEGKAPGILSVKPAIEVAWEIAFQGESQ